MALDAICRFALRDVLADDIAKALGWTYRDFNLWSAQAKAIFDFPQDAEAAGVEDVLLNSSLAALDLAESMKIIKPAEGTVFDKSAYARLMSAHRLALVLQSAKLAAVVLLHSGFERYLFRLVRFAMVGARGKAIEYIERKHVSIADMQFSERDALIDGHLEKWWEELERAPLLRKWDVLIGLIGHPDILNRGDWRFDRSMIERFDNVRHDCVHHEGGALESFNLNEWMAQLTRAALVLLSPVTDLFQVQISAEIAFGGFDPLSTE